MNALIEELSLRARALPPEDRARLAEELLASLQNEPESESDAAWDIEIRRRVEQVKSGTAKLISAEEVHAQARQLYR
jgi:putative addiction module component (TIGR02574 family)